MRFLTHFLLPPVVLMLLFMPSVHADDESYAVEEKGRSSLASTFDKKKDTSAEQWAYAQATREKGRLKKAERRMQYLVRRWPNSLEAPEAQRARADILLERGKLKDAFEEYQLLIDNYSSRMHDYDAVLRNQFLIAEKLMDKRRMRWLFGGYRTPEYAVPYFEDVIRNGPQWDRAPEAQYLIGQCHSKADELEEAIGAYGVLGYRYPDSDYAEQAAWEQIQCLDELRREYPNSVDLLDRTLTATTVFLSTYTTSDYNNDIIKLRNELYEVKAGKAFDEAAFYAKVPRKPEAAILYYEQMIEEYPKSKLVPEAEKRIVEIRSRIIRTAPAPAPAGTPVAPVSGEERANDRE